MANKNQEEIEAKGTVFPIRYLRVSMVSYENAESKASTVTEYLKTDAAFQGFRKCDTIPKALAYMADAEGRQTKNRLEQLNDIVKRAQEEQAKLKSKL